MTQSKSQQRRITAQKGEVTPDAEMNIAPFKDETIADINDRDHTPPEPPAEAVPETEPDTGWVGNHIDDEIRAPEDFGRIGGDQPSVDNDEANEQELGDHEDADDEDSVDAEPYFYEYTHEDTVGLIVAALNGKADSWEAEAYAESFKGAANTQAMQAYRWAAGQVRELAVLIGQLPDGEMREPEAPEAPPEA